MIKAFGVVRDETVCVTGFSSFYVVSSRVFLSPSTNLLHFAPAACFSLTRCAVCVPFSFLYANEFPYGEWVGVQKERPITKR